MSKERVDVLVVNQGLADSREKAKRMVMAGQIYDTNNERLDKAGQKIPVETVLHIKGEKLRYVSRGGLKLEKAINDFNIDMTDQNLLDIGSSTGGFTDAALQHGATHSYALDVGTNQLAWKIRSDERVTVMEQTNFRYATPDMFVDGQPTISSIDVSFISLKLILPPLKLILKDGGQVLALIKPQFEAGREKVGKKGIVRDSAVHLEVLENVIGFAKDLGYDVKHLTFSPITGGDGNIEFLAELINHHSEDHQGQYLVEESLNQVVENAHNLFNN